MRIVLIKSTSLYGFINYKLEEYFQYKILDINKNKYELHGLWFLIFFVLIWMHKFIWILRFHLYMYITKLKIFLSFVLIISITWLLKIEIFYLIYLNYKINSFLNKLVDENFDYLNIDVLTLLIYFKLILCFVF